MTPRVDGEQVSRFVAHLQEHALGRANAQTARQLSRSLHLGPNGDRLLRALAHAATEAGIVVCTGNSGYWLPETQAEAEETIGRLYSQGTEMIRRANALRALVSRRFASSSGKQIGLL